MRYRRNLLNRGLVWLARFRYRKGYGVQSPSVYHFIRHVIFETAPYYEYERLKRDYLAIKSYEKRVFPRKRYELIFRIAHEIKATEIIEIGTSTGLGTMYASAARKTATCCIVNPFPITHTGIRKVWSMNPGPIIQKSGPIDFDLPQIVKNSGNPSASFILLDCHFFPESECARWMDTILKNLKPADCVFLHGIHRSKALLRQWKLYTKHSSVSISFDLYEAGILFSKPSFPQKCYLINY